ncbi:hypothetical protein HGRIS_008206 [Hohenbuehelia grisea]|uniref:Yeast cell wall synthesis Kre9/Knh1-like N-terminal domain-containing protein n=1 Tax=Hohenbuehelia grisea TaxID=104357 RepID=A0ABR3J7Q1_9AGAR
MKLSISSTLVTLFCASAIALAFPFDADSAPWPTITSPKSGEVWKAGEERTITWDASNPPADLTDTNAFIWLQGGAIDGFNVLAGGVDILSGAHTVKVPNVSQGDDYSVLLFGQMRTSSPRITIKA